MLDYLKHVYEGILAGILSKWVALYPVLGKAGLVLLGALLVWAIFRWSMKRVRKRIRKYEFMGIHDQIFYIFIPEFTEFGASHSDNCYFIAESHNIPPQPFSRSGTAFHV